MGSPPRMRGKPVVKNASSRDSGITPAHAGKTFRAGGKAQCPAGSPPRMRGKLRGGGCAFMMVGITPAHAGKTTRCCAIGAPPQDHPRACGENLGLHPLPQRSVGSPPRMRGKRGGIPIRSHNYRITPAHAGKTRWGICAPYVYKDHPRACGENWCGCCTV